MDAEPSGDLPHGPARISRMTKALLASLLLAGLVGPAADGANGGRPVALVTAERQNQLLAVELPSGRPEGGRRERRRRAGTNVAAGPGRVAVVVSTKAGAVTLLDTRTLRPLGAFRGFESPHLAALDPCSSYAYVTDDGTGQLAVIRLARPRIVARLFVGLGAHDLAF